MVRAASYLVLGGLMDHVAGVWAQTPPVLTNVAQIRALSADEATRKLPVRIRGVVTFMDPDLFVAFIRDETGGAYFSPRGSTAGPVARCRVGDLVELEGFTNPGRFAPHIVNIVSPPRVRVLGHPGLPEPRRLAPQELINPANHCERIEIVGVVRGIGRERGKLRLDLSTSAGSFRAVLPLPWDGGPSPATNWIGAVLRLRGVYGSLFNENRELAGLRVFVAGIDDVLVEDPGAESFDRRPVREIRSLLRFSDQTGPRVRLAGVVTHVEPGRGLFLQDDTAPVRVFTPQRDPLPPGTRADAVGYPGTADGQPVLRDGFVRVLGRAEQPAPLVVSAAEAFTGRLHGRLVRLRGTVLDRFIQPGNHLLLLNDGGLSFAARLIEPGSPRLLDLPERGSVTEVTGIALNDFVPDPDRAGEETPRFRAVSLQLHLRAPADMRVLRPAPYWTRERLQWLAAGVITVLLLAAAWIALLRRQVARQTALIKAKVARETLQEERARMARELHDTLEQQLTGLSLQLDAAGDTLADSPEVAQRALAAAQGLLKHTRAEARRSIWDLRPSALEDGDLLAALRETLSHASPGERPEINIAATGTARRLPAAVESGLLRIATEAVTNAVKHAQAASVRVQLTYKPDAVELTVRDDGCGFDATATPAAGHFGLTGMRERAARMNARLRIESRPGRGTTLTLTVPVTNDPPDSA